MYNIEPQFGAAYAACETSRQILTILPECDLLDEMSEILETQNILFHHMIENRHVGTQALDIFLDKCIHINNQVIRLREEIED